MAVRAVLVYESRNKGAHSQKNMKRKRSEQDDYVDHIKSCLLQQRLYNDVICLILRYAQQIHFRPNQQPSRQVAEQIIDQWSMTVDGNELFVVQRNGDMISVFDVTYGRFLRGWDTKATIHFPEKVYATSNHLVVQSQQNKFTVVSKDLTSHPVLSFRGGDDWRLDCSRFVANNHLTFIDVYARLSRSYGIPSGVASGPWKPLPDDWYDHYQTDQIKPYVVPDENQFCFVTKNFCSVATASASDLTWIHEYNIKHSQMQGQMIYDVAIYGSQLVLLMQGDCCDWLVVCDRQSDDIVFDERLKVGCGRYDLAVAESQVDGSPIIFARAFGKRAIIEVYE